MSEFWFIALIPLLPACGVLLNGLLGKRFFSRRLTHLIACGTVAGSFITAAIAFIRLLGLPAHERAVAVVYYQLIQTASFHLDLKLLLDPLSCAMLLMVSGVGFLIHVYSIGYMSEEADYTRYFTYLNLFMCAMLLLVSGGNFVLLFVGWEGVGLCSYLLIGFWFEKDSAANAGKKAFIVNRVGDFGFLIGMFWIYTVFGSLDFAEVFAAAPDTLAMGGAVATIITLLLFVGATGKSAQIPLYVWLPDAMEGPTPVSALIHAATMVTAGVYMVARCHILYLLAPISLGVVATVGALTAIYSASIALVQNDIKKVLAYSTISQLGYMFLGCGTGAFVAGIFHLITHAFFKALLFLGSGSVIHAMHHVLHHHHDHDTDPQDMRNMGGLRTALPWTYGTFLVATLAIAGIPPFAGFFSKDEILWSAFAGTHGHWALWLVGATAAGMTAFYM
ncbi:NADH-quinone oxidoreductase subunit L, partial [bacterium]|nr:NADH-quinone oxidoreductase subunit L [candidate division CSSED10-310 bacterium]